VEAAVAGDKGHTHRHNSRSQSVPSKAQRYYPFTKGGSLGSEYSKNRRKGCLDCPACEVGACGIAGLLLPLPIHPAQRGCESAAEIRCVIPSSGLRTLFAHAILRNGKSHSRRRGVSERIGTASRRKNHAGHRHFYESREGGNLERGEAETQRDREAMPETGKAID
jgi:hypothetical protein